MKRAISVLLFLAGTPALADAPLHPESLGPAIIHLPSLQRHANRGILRPVPIVAQLPNALALRARRVLLHYRLWGDPDWTILQLRSTGTRFEGAIPCLQVSTVTGDLRYYIRVHDSEGQVVASAGTRAKPYVVTIKHDAALTAEATSEAKCPDPADCPPGLPGCPSEKVDAVCLSDKDCEGGMVCAWRGVCERVDRPRNFAVVSLEQDFGIVGTAGACDIPDQESAGYACFRSDGAQYLGTPVLTNEPLGLGRGPTRAVIGFERLVFYDTSLGVRIGWAGLGIGPTPRGGTPFFPGSIAARATHWFGGDLFARAGFRPYAFVGFGYQMTDIETRVSVRENPAVPSRQPGNSLEQNLELWKRAGDGFVGAGGGWAWAFDTRRLAFVELMIAQAFPFGALLVVPTAGGMFAF
jgi:hypothetical protein